VCKKLAIWQLEQNKGTHFQPKEQLKAASVQVTGGIGLLTPAEDKSMFGGRLSGIKWAARRQACAQKGRAAATEP